MNLESTTPSAARKNEGKEQRTTRETETSHGKDGSIDRTKGRERETEREREREKVKADR
jgi:hypothetical protein